MAFIQNGTADAILNEREAKKPRKNDKTTPLLESEGVPLFQFRLVIECVVSRVDAGREWNDDWNVLPGVELDNRRWDFAAFRSVSAFWRLAVPDDI